MSYSTHCEKRSLSDQAIEFRTAYQVLNSPSNRTTQKHLIDEEFAEFSQAHSREPDANILKELADLVYVCYQYAENMEWDLDEAMHRVHESNMSKLGLDGKPIRREDGKVLKGPNYKPPTLTDLVS
tara:strand:- start:34 stop:411 length:378 start_codon:yes stop_codon:yes gene_type:complete